MTRRVDSFREFARQMLVDGSLDGQQSVCVRGLLEEIETGAPAGVISMASVTPPFNEEHDS